MVELWMVVTCAGIAVEGVAGDSQVIAQVSWPSQVLSRVVVVACCHLGPFVVELLPEISAWVECAGGSSSSNALCVCVDVL